MKGFVEATQEAGPCLIEPSLRATSGQIYRKKKKCDQCQRFAPNMHQPGEVLNPLSSPWPFTQWGLDIVGHFPKATGNKRYLLVGTDYFTKWVETEPLANIRDVDSFFNDLWSRDCYSFRNRLSNTKDRLIQSKQ